MIQLSKKESVREMRFFGKIRGTEKDYYIVEGEVDAGEEDPENTPPPDQEAKGSGVNKKTYWVASSALSTWDVLPDLAPKDLAASRNIKVLFTGDLNRAIITNPFFFKQEKHYLRA